MPASVMPDGPKRYLSKVEAAHWAGVSPRVFDDEVAAGRWPMPFRRGDKGGALTWDLKLLEHAADRLAGLIASETPGGDLSDGEQRALEAAGRGTTKKNRNQHGQQKAA